MPIIIENYINKCTGEFIRFTNGKVLIAFHEISNENPAITVSRRIIYTGYALFHNYTLDQIHALTPEHEELLYAKECNLIQSNVLDTCLDIAIDLVKKSRNRKGVQANGTRARLKQDSIKITDPDVVRLMQEKRLPLEMKVKLDAFYGWYSLAKNLGVDLMDPKLGVINIVNSIKKYIEVFLPELDVSYAKRHPSLASSRSPKTSAIFSLPNSPVLPPPDGVLEERLYTALLFYELECSNPIAMKQLGPASCVLASTLQLSSDSESAPSGRSFTPQFSSSSSLSHSASSSSPSSSSQSSSPSPSLSPSLSPSPSPSSSPSPSLSPSSSPRLDPTKPLSLRPSISSLEAYKELKCFRIIPSLSPSTSPALSPVSPKKGISPLSPERSLTSTPLTATGPEISDPEVSLASVAREVTRPGL